MNAIGTVQSGELLTSVQFAKEQLLLAVGEVWRVPTSLREFRILTGTAWVSREGKDTVLNTGDHFSVANSKDVVVVSAVNRASVLLELIRR